jgi:subtilisin family serine protease
MDRAITLRRNFNSGMPSVAVSGNGTENNPFVFNSLKIDVVNMSLGGPTLFAGRELDEQLTLKMLEVGIAPAISAGNEGFGAMTAAGPGDGMGALDMAASNDVAHERVLRDVQFGIGIGVLYRPTTHTQTAYFSSRGPTADGRFKPDVIANGFATFAQGTCQGVASCIAGATLAPISFVSGTSFSAPTAAGALALLRKGAPSASAAQLRNAIIETANPLVLGDGSGLIDQGRGFLDVGAAIARLRAVVKSKVAGSDPGQKRPREHSGDRLPDRAAGRGVLDARVQPGARTRGAVPGSDGVRRPAPSRSRTTP